MSKLSNAILAYKTNETRWAPLPVPRYLEVNERYDTSGITREVLYRICATFGSQVWVREGELISPAVRIARENVIEAVFGEFREGLLELTQMIYESDREGALNKINNIIEQMYECRSPD